MSALFQCSACPEAIPENKARVVCQRCHGVNLCTNCFVLQKFAQQPYIIAGGHQADHPTLLFRTSGRAPVPLAVPGSIELDAGPVLPRSGAGTPQPPTPNSLQSQTPSLVKDLTGTDQASGAAVPSVQRRLSENPPAIVHDDASAPEVVPQQLQRHQTAPTGAWSNTPPSEVPPGSLYKVPSPAHSLSPAISDRTGNYSPLNGMQGLAMQPQMAPVPWSPLFVGNQPTPMMISLLQEIFLRLDPNNTGAWTPEAYSSFLDAQGVDHNENPWRKNLLAVPGFTPEEYADSQLRKSFNTLRIDHRVAQRPPSNNSAAMSIPYGGTPIYEKHMPLLTHQGLVDLAKVSVSIDPSKAWGRYSAVVLRYDIWREKGPMPRYCFPDHTSLHALDSLARVAESTASRAFSRILSGKH